MKLLIGVLEQIIDIGKQIPYAVLEEERLRKIDDYQFGITQISRNK